MTVNTLFISRQSITFFMSKRALTLCLSLFLMLILSACQTTPTAPKVTDKSAQTPITSSKPVPALPKANSGKGAYYLDDGPGDNPPPNLDLTVDAEPKVEPYSASGNKPYVVFGKTYTPFTDERPFTQRGMGSWYGKKFHGQRTSSGELYDMYKMTAAHPTLPIPSYARITNVSNGRQVIVKINDRGPFHTSRIVDLSYTAALKLDYLNKGSTELLLERLLPADIEKMAENKKQNPTQNITAPTTANNSQSTILANQNASTSTAQPINLPPAISAKPLPTNPAPAVINSPNNASGYYLQFGAFGLRSNAEATYNHLQTTLSQLPNFEIVQQDTLYRLFSGPFATREEAEQAQAQTVKAGVNKTFIVQR